MPLSCVAVPFCGLCATEVPKCNTRPLPRRKWGKNASQTETEGQRWDRFLEVLTIQNQMIWDDCGKWKSDGPGRIKPKKLQFFCPTSLVLDLFHVQFTLVRFWWKLMQWSYPWIRCGKKHISGCIRGRGYINSSLDTLPETNLASENRQSLKGKIILQCLILRGYSMLISRIVYKWHGITILANMFCPIFAKGHSQQQTGLLSPSLLLIMH